MVTGGGLFGMELRSAALGLAFLAAAFVGDWTGEPIGATLELEVSDSQSGKPLPCRITIVDRQNRLAPLKVTPSPELAVRQGVIYTASGSARCELPPGDYRVYAGRGFEYGLALAQLSLHRGKTHKVALNLRREVRTPGLVSCDTHVHTRTFSGHGDASLEERLVTLAGEGIELPVATDHNRHVDYREIAGHPGASWFTPAIGNEVTTRAGHFNVFPIRPGSAVPDDTLTDWSRLFQALRDIPAVRMIVLNHPRDLHSNFRPFDPANFNSVTGESRQGLEFGFNGLEVVNSGALQSDLMRVYRDWFALLNHGRRITAVGSSDCHDVNRHIVGQGRTYIYSDDRNPAAIEIDGAFENLARGRALVSMGLLTNIRIQERFASGDLATGVGRLVRVRVEVSGPRWVRADRVELYVNGRRIRSEEVRHSENAVEKARTSWTLERPAHDVWLVAIASGPGVTEPYWPLPPPYQPTSDTWEPRVVGSTNPVWLDADGDGSYTAPREYAARLVQRFGDDPERLFLELGRFDEAVAIQAASIWHSSGVDVRSPELAAKLSSARAAVQSGFAAFTATLETSPQTR
jgi:hypothetical protein